MSLEQGIHLLKVCLLKVCFNLSNIQGKVFSFFVEITSFHAIHCSSMQTRPYTFLFVNYCFCSHPREHVWIEKSSFLVLEKLYTILLCLGFYFYKHWDLGVLLFNSLQVESAKINHVCVKNKRQEITEWLKNRLRSSISNTKTCQLN